MSGNHGDDVDLDFKVILGPTADGEWQPEETKVEEEANGSEVIMQAVYCSIIYRVHHLFIFLNWILLDILIIFVVVFFLFFRKPTKFINLRCFETFVLSFYILLVKENIDNFD